MRYKINSSFMLIKCYATLFSNSRSSDANEILVANYGYLKWTLTSLEIYI